MVREVEKWSGIHIQDRITTKSWLVFPTGAPNDNTTFQCNRLIIFPVILLTDTTKNRTNKQVADNPTWLHNLHLLGANDTTSISVYLCLWTTATLINMHMSIRTHVTAIVRACFAALRQIRSVRRSLSRHTLLTLVRALIVSKVDYCNSVLAGIPDQLQDRLQSVLNAAAHLVFSARRSERITPLLRELHWLRVPERVTFWLCILAYRCLHGTAPAYLAESLHRTSDVDTRRRLHSADSAMLVVPSTTFPVASARAWNSLPSSVRNILWLTTFRRELKTVLFRSSFDND